MNLYLVAVLLIHLIRFSYQQINVCPFGHDHFNGECVQSSCPDTHYLSNGACLLRPTGTASCGYGFDLINGMCIQQNCPINFSMVNGLCQPNVHHNQHSLYCPTGFSIYNEMCFPNPGIIAPPFCQPKPCWTQYCPFTCEDISTRTSTTTSTTTTTTSTTTPPTITTTTTVAPCAEEYVLIDGECRFAYCLKGTFYRGRCLEPVCAGGLVWNGLTCTYPEVITTVLEIENKFITERNQTGPDFHAYNATNNIIHITESYDASKVAGTIDNSNKKCCTIMTPRMCKRYDSKWVCFNRQYRQCGEVCGTYSMKYLTVPKVIEYPGMLVIPPNPPLKSCSGSQCATSDVVDCSGCLTQQKEKCAPYCYRYRCPLNRCTYIDQSEYCTKYRGSPGCSNSDGCFESYCCTRNESNNQCL